MDQMSLLGADLPTDDPSVADTRVDEAREADANSDLPPLIRHYIESWPQYCAAIAAAEQTVADLQRAESQLGKSYPSAWRWDPLGRSSMCRLADEALEAVTEYARRTLCAGDDSVLSAEDARRLIDESAARRGREHPDFGAYWRLLVERFGGGHGQRRAMERAAARLRFELGILRADQRTACSLRVAPKLERGGVTFNLGVRRMRRAYSGPDYVLDYQGRKELSELLERLALAVGDDLDLDAALEAFKYAAPDLTVERLPHRLDLGAWRWTFLKENTRLWMPEADALLVRAALDELDPGE